MDLSKRASDQDPNVQQALRRLKYLHTSLTSPVRTKGANLKPIQTTSSPPLNETTENDSENQHQRCFLALSPDNEYRPIARNDRQVSRHRIGLRPVCRGRVPLRSSHSQFSPAFRPLSTKRRSLWDKPKREATFAANNNNNNKDKTSTRTSKSAPSGVVSSPLNPEEFDCIQCFADEVQRLQNEECTKYTNNIKINRVTFSARPRPTRRENTSKRVTKTVSERSLDIPQTLFGGWGVRSKRKINPETTRRNPRDSRREDDLNAHFETLRITPCGSDDGSRKGDYLPYPPPAAPPTPVRQIDIKMPEGIVVQYRLQTVP